MIDSVVLYNDIKKLIIKDGRTGFFSISDFNSLCVEVENILLSYYCDVLEDNSERMERLAPMVKEVSLNVPKTGYVSFPSKYRRFIDMGYSTVTSAPDCAEPIIGQEFALDYAASDEWKSTINSATRKPDAGKDVGYYRIVNNKFQVSFNSGIATLVYVERPNYANIVFTYDVVNQEPIIASKTDFVWLEQDRSNLIDLFALHLGLSHRETVLIDWAKIKKK